MATGGSVHTPTAVPSANASGSSSEPDLKSVTKVAFLGGLGSYFEYFDFFIALLATGIAWPVVFYSNLPSSAAIALSLFSYALTFFTRPVGAYFFGHFGDRIGRKRVLFVTLMLMGLGSLGITILPGVSAIGVAAPILLSVIRLIQGFGLGGEAGGAATWVLEVAATSKHRGFWTSWVQFGSPAGLATSAILTSFLVGFQGHAVFVDWGWRVPFLVGGVAAVIGGFLRYRLMESPIFEKLARKNVEKFPASHVLKRQWKKILHLASVNFPETLGTSVQVVPFTVVYMLQLHMNPSFASGAAVYLASGAMVSTVIVGVLCDYVGRKLFLVLSCVVGVGLAYPFYLVVGTANEGFIIAIMFVWGFGVYLQNAILPAFFTESYATNVRYSGASLSMQTGLLFSGIVIGIVLPAVLATSNGIYANIWPSVAAITIITSLISLIAAVFVKETKDVVVDDSSAGAKEIEGANQ